jgi:hypothetical protein
MAYMFARPDGSAIAGSAIILDAARCWRQARDSGQPVLPCLTAILHDHGGGMLAPCLDSLMALAEAVLGRPLRVGHAHEVSADEHLLLDWFAGAEPAEAPIACGEGLAAALDCAVRSTRILLPQR